MVRIKIKDLSQDMKVSGQDMAKITGGGLIWNNGIGWKNGMGWNNGMGWSNGMGWNNGTEEEIMELSGTANYGTLIYKPKED